MQTKNKTRHSNIFFLRHGKVALPYPSHDAMPFGVLNRLAKQELDPVSDKSYFDTRISYFEAFLKRVGFNYFFYSPSQRCVSLASYIQGLPNFSIPQVEMRTELQEIKFDLTKMFSDGETSLSQVKVKMSEQLVQRGTGVEDLSDILSRIQKFMSGLPQSGNILVLTHGYLMTVIAALLQNRSGEISKENLDLIPRFGYFDGFSIGENGTIKYFSIENQIDVPRHNAWPL